MAVATGTALLGGALLGAAGSIAGGSTAAGAAKDAARTQAGAADRAAQLQNQMFQQQQQYLAPYRQTGYTATPLLEYLTTGQMPTLSAQDLQELQRLQSIGTQQPVNAMAPQPQAPQGYQGELATYGEAAQMFGGNKTPQGFTPMTNMVAQSQQTELTTEEQTRLEQLLARQKAGQMAQGGLQGMIESSPMYQYQRDIGEKNLNRALAARGRSNSTFGVNALGEQNRALVAGESQNLYNRIAGLSNLGLGVANTLGQNAMATGTNIGNLYQNAGNAMAQGQLNAGQQQASMYSNLGALPMQAYGQYQLINALNK
jgi:hypothetical protein